jgi:hypothetical protein
MLQIGHGWSGFDVDMSGCGQRSGGFYLDWSPGSSSGRRSMSVLDDFARIRVYRERASEFELLAETEASPNVRLSSPHHRAPLSRTRGP